MPVGPVGPVGSGDGVSLGEGDGLGVGDGTVVGGPIVWPSFDGTAKSSTGLPCIATVMKSCQMAAGIVPPKTGENALHAVQRDLALWVADPHARRELRRVAAEPRIDVVLRGPGLPGHRTAEEAGRRAGPVRDDVLPARK